MKTHFREPCKNGAFDDGSLNFHQTRANEEGWYTACRIIAIDHTTRNGDEITCVPCRDYYIKMAMSIT